MSFLFYFLILHFKMPHIFQNTPTLIMGSVVTIKFIKKNFSNPFYRHVYVIFRHVHFKNASRIESESLHISCVTVVPYNALTLKNTTRNLFAKLSHNYRERLGQPTQPCSLFDLNGLSEWSDFILYMIRS